MEELPAAHASPSCSPGPEQPLGLMETCSLSHRSQAEQGTLLQVCTDLGSGLTEQSLKKSWLTPSGAGSRITTLSVQITILF